MRPAAVAELASEPKAKGPYIGLHAVRVAGRCDGLGGFNGEEGGIATGEDISDGGLLGGTGVEALGREERGGVDERGFGVVVEA